jgi:hypothetical protein
MVIIPTIFNQDEDKKEIKFCNNIKYNITKLLNNHIFGIRVREFDLSPLSYEHNTSIFFL